MAHLPENSPIRLVTFDLYDTLVEADPPRYRRFERALLGMDMPLDERTLHMADRAAEDYYTIENGSHPIRDRDDAAVETFRLESMRVFLEAAGLPDDPETVRDARRRYTGEIDAIGWVYRAFDDVMPALTMLEEAGVMRAVISNADRDITEFCLHMGFASHMDLIVTSALVGWEKPDKRTFFAALDPLDVHPNDAIHIGDQPLSDVKGARAIGMHAALVDRYDRHEDGEHDALRVRSLVELSEAVVAHNTALQPA